MPNFKQDKSKFMMKGAFKMKGYSAFDKNYDSPNKQKIELFGHAPPEKPTKKKKKTTSGGPFDQTDEKKDIQIEKKPTVSNLNEQLDKMGVTENQVISWANENIPWFESGDWGDQYDDNDILKWGRLLSKDLYEGNVDEID